MFLELLERWADRRRMKANEPAKVLCRCAQGVCCNVDPRIGRCFMAEARQYSNSPEYRKARPPVGTER